MAPDPFLRDLFSLEGRVAVVTGASSGIGRRMALTLARAGADVLCLARREDVLSELVLQIETDGSRALPVKCDLASIADFGGLADELATHFGAPDILVNAAGINLRESPEAITPQSWHDTLHLNLSVPFFLARELVPGMKKKGGGAIINIASLQSFRAFANSMAYGASKGGIAQLTRAMAEAWSKDGIHANAIMPGFFPTALTEPVFSDPALSQKHAAATALGRNGKLADLDGATVFLASNASAFVTGHILPVDGGYLAR